MFLLGFGFDHGGLVGCGGDGQFRIGGGRGFRNAIVLGYCGRFGFGFDGYGRPSIVVVVGFHIACAVAIHCIGPVAAAAAAVAVAAAAVVGSYPKIAAIAGLDHSVVVVVHFLKQQKEVGEVEYVAMLFQFHPSSSACPPPHRHWL